MRPSVWHVSIHTHKFGIKVPKSVNEALRMDEETGTTFWRDSIAKEMKNVMTAFEFRNKDKMPIGHKKIDCNMIFDIKMDLTRKSWLLVAGDHQTEESKEMIFSPVVSHESVCIAFLYAALNDLEVLACDIRRVSTRRCGLTKKRGRPSGTTGSQRK